MWPKPQFPRDLVTFTEEIINGKLHSCEALDLMPQNNLVTVKPTEARNRYSWHFRKNSKKTSVVKSIISSNLEPS